MYIFLKPPYFSIVCVLKGSVWYLFYIRCSLKDEALEMIFRLTLSCHMPPIVFFCVEETCAMWLPKTFSEKNTFPSSGKLSCFETLDNSFNAVFLRIQAVHHKWSFGSVLLLSFGIFLNLPTLLVDYLASSVCRFLLCLESYQCIFFFFWRRIQIYYT